MKILFAYDLKAVKDENGVLYTNGTITEDAWKDRYCCLGKVTFISRMKNTKVKSIDAEKKYCKINNDVNFERIYDLYENVPSFFSYKKRKYNKNLVRNCVKQSDLVISRIPSIPGYHAIKYARKYNKKIIVEVVGCPWDSLWNHSIKGKFLAIPSFLRLKKYVRQSKNVIYVTNKFLQKRYPTKGNSIGCSDVQMEPDKKFNINTRIDKILNLEKKINKKIVIGTCAAVDVKYKGQEYVIKALSILKKKGYANYEYQMVGNGNYKRLYNIAVKYDVIDQVKFIGSITHDKVFEWMDNIDLYIQPSNQEGLCRSVIEAESRGLPIIVSNAGGNSELVNKEFVFKRKNYKQLSKIIQSTTYKKMQEEANKNYKNSKQYEKNKLLNKRKKFIETILKSGEK